ncbi:hypothetical protein Y032_0053g2384 [Ancylostoma ceylanicum]|uniref:Uncharacterized protein n=1 Tax=Ancylostoma ceylanicum TaxID=53326 RepID=A0A016U7P6_9BILA|nr:hypothetical protein Y032_0053g2384 [Ancylostoma ceylanicum]
MQRRRKPDESKEDQKPLEKEDKEEMKEELEKESTNADTVVTFGPLVTPTCSTLTALSTNRPCYWIDAVRVQTDGRDGWPEYANQSRLATPLFPLR